MAGAAERARAARVRGGVASMTAKRRGERAGGLMTTGVPGVTSENSSATPALLMRMQPMLAGLPRRSSRLVPWM